MTTTMRLSRRPQWLAIAWLRQGEPRPALDILRSDDALSPELRHALAEWIANGSKRKKGAKVVRDPWEELPPLALGTPDGGAEKVRWPMNAKEERAWILFVTWPLKHLDLYTNETTARGRGRPKAPDGLAADHVAAELNISERVAREWRDRFFPKGLMD